MTSIISPTHDDAVIAAARNEIIAPLTEKGWTPEQIEAVVLSYFADALAAHEVTA